MRVLYVYAHPMSESFHAAILAEALTALQRGGHDVDLLDLNVEKFDPVMSEEERRVYHDVPLNRTAMQPYVDRLLQAEAVILQFPVWTFGPPAILKGFLDRLMMPGVGFDFSDPTRVRPLLTHVRRVVGITTHGQKRLMVALMGDYPRKLIKRYLRRAFQGARVTYLPLYHLNVADLSTRTNFIRRVGYVLSRL